MLLRGWAKNPALAGTITAQANVSWNQQPDTGKMVSFRLSFTADGKSLWIEIPRSEAESLFTSLAQALGRVEWRVE